HGVRCHRRRRLVLGGELGLHRAVDDLVELTAVEPHASARGAVVDLDPLALGHDERGLVDGAQHRILLAVAWSTRGPTRGAAPWLRHPEPPARALRWCPRRRPRPPTRSRRPRAARRA